MARLSKKQEQALFWAEFVRRLREAPSGTRVYMAVGDLFKDTDVPRLDDWRAARRAQAVRNDEKNTSR